jgi:hypothetical protein
MGVMCRRCGAVLGGAVQRSVSGLRVRGVQDPVEIGGDMCVAGTVLGSECAFVQLLSGKGRRRTRRNMKRQCIQTVQY